MGGGALALVGHFRVTSLSKHRPVLPGHTQGRKSPGPKPRALPGPRRGCFEGMGTWLSK